MRFRTPPLFLLLAAALALAPAALPRAAAAQDASPARQAAAAPTALRGDVNGDGRVTILDAVAVVAYVVGRDLPATYSVAANGDADGNGQITTMDALVIAGYAAGRDVSRFPVGTALQPARNDAVDCAADVRAGTIQCRTPQPALPSGVSAMILGGQDVYVRLTSRNSAYDAATRTFSADVRLTNLLSQSLGLDATGHPAAEGIRIFFNSISSPTVSVMDSDGQDVFLAPDQPFYQYDAPLAPGDSTQPKRWKWHLPAGVESFTFRVYAAAPVEYPTDGGNLAQRDQEERENGVVLSLVSGGGQTGTPGQPLAQPVVVRVVDSKGRPFADRTVNFLVEDGGSAEPRQTRTDTAGYARTTWTLGPGTGTHQMRVSGTGGTILVTAGTAAPAPVPVRVRITPDSLVLAVGAAGSFAAAAVDSAGTVVAGGAVAWASLDTAVARVDGAGHVTALAAGTARIRATIGALSATATVRVTPPPPARVVWVRLSPDSLVVQATATGTFTATPFDSLGNPVAGLTATWRSSDTTVAKVSAAGVVTGLKAGSATITVTLGGVSATGRVRVTPPPPGRIVRVRVIPDNVSLIQLKWTQLTAVAYDSAGQVVADTGYTHWSSSLPNNVPVNLTGRVNAVAPGTATITATIGGVSGTGTVTVPPVTSYPPRVTWIEMRRANCCGYVDVATTDQTLNFFIDVSSHVETFTMRVRSPSGAQHIDCTSSGVVGAEPQDEYNNRRFRCSLDIPAHSEPGSWIVEQATVGGTLLRTADLDTMNTPGRRFEVLGGGADATPPQVRGVSSYGRSTYGYGVNFAVVDHVSGTTSVSAVFEGRNGQRVSCNAPNLHAGAPVRSGDWTCNLNVPAGSGRWHLVSVTTTDALGNTVTRTPADLEPLRGVFEYTHLEYDFDSDAHS